MKTVKGWTVCVFLCLLAAAFLSPPAGAESAAARIKRFRTLLRTNPAAAFKALVPADHPRIVDELVALLAASKEWGYYLQTRVEEALLTTTDGPPLERLHSHLFRHTDGWVRCRIAVLLGKMRRDASLPKLKSALARAPNTALRVALIEALGNYGPDRAAEAILPYLSDSRRPEVRIAAVETLAAMKAVSAVEKIVPLTQGGNLQLRCCALWALGVLGGERAKAAVLAAMKAASAPVRAAACDAAASLPGADVREALCAMLSDPSWEVISAAVNSLRKRNEIESVRPLVEAMQSAKGRLLDDFRDALETITGYRFGSDPRNWKDWLEETGGDVRRNPRPREDLSPYITYHRIRTRSLNMVFCIDVSGSMGEKASPRAAAYVGEGAKLEGDTKLDFVKAELIRTILALPPEARFDIVAFSDDAAFWRGSQVKATDRAKKAATAFVRGLKPAGGTNVYAALKAAFGKLKQDTPHYSHDRDPDTVFLLSDGLPTLGEITDPAKLLELITRLNRVRQVTIHTIGVGRKGEPFLKPLALRNRGKYVLIAE